MNIYKGLLILAGAIIGGMALGLGIGRLIAGDPIDPIQTTEFMKNTMQCTMIFTFWLVALLALISIIIGSVKAFIEGWKS